MNDSLQNKCVLFFSPAFFGYENKIKDKMENLGAHVDMFDERSVSKSHQKALLKINPSIYHKRTEKYYFDIFEKVKQNHYDFILFVKCDMPTDNVLKAYKDTFKKAKMCLHMWDSIKNIPNVESKFKYFDYISSFDRQDSLNYPSIEFRPLFYCDEYCKECGNSFKYDICFIGTIHSDRYKIIREICDKAQKLNMTVYTYPFLQSKFIYYFYKLTKKEFRKTKISDFRFDKISAEEISNIVNQSKAVIDIQHPKQTGLTMRTIEMIGMNKKLITTNEDIINYDFYDSNNIQIIDRNNPNLNKEIFVSDYKKLDNEIYNKYSLKQWVLDVVGIDDVK